MTDGTFIAAAGVILFARMGAAQAANQASWSVTVLGDTADSRFEAVVQAVQHWNEELASIGAGLRFGSVTASVQRLPEELLRTLSEGVVARRRLALPPQLDPIAGDVVIALAGSELTSVGIAPNRFGRAVVVLRPGNIPPLALPNVARNVVAHELGHVLGLNHNRVPGTLMCGPPTCRPTAFQSPSPIFFPLTQVDQRELARRWR